MATKVPAGYPAAVWDGVSTTRPTPLAIDRNPDYEDWDQMTAELIAAQTDLKAIDGDNVATLANASVIGGIPVVHIVNIADSSADTDVVLTYKTRITDVVVVKTTGAGGSGDTLTVKNGSTAVTNAISLNIADKAVARAGTIDDASHEIAAGGTLRLTAAKSTSVAAIAYVYGVRVA